MESSSFARQLSELKNAANFVRSVLELKRRQTAILLMGIRQDILAGSDHHFHLPTGNVERSYGYCRI